MAVPDVFTEGDRSAECCLVLDGFLGRYKILAEDARQFVFFHMPGDMPDLQSMQLEYVDHGLAALMRSRVGYIPHAAIQALMEDDRHIAALLAKYILVDASIFRAWIANVGCRDALRRVAHLLCELLVRCRTLGLVTDNVLFLPITQSQLGDATGLSAVHVNRVMQQLRRLQLISTRGQNHTIISGEGLREVGDFNPAYLHLKQAAYAVGFEKDSLLTGGLITARDERVQDSEVRGRGIGPPWVAAFGDLLAQTFWLFCCLQHQLNLIGHVRLSPQSVRRAIAPQ